MPKNKKHSITWLLGVLTKAKERGIDTFHFSQSYGLSFRSPQIYEAGISNLTGVTLYLKDSKFDRLHQKQEEKDRKEERANKKYKRMIEIWNNSPVEVQEKFLKALLYNFSEKFMLNKKQAKELSKYL